MFENWISNELKLVRLSIYSFTMFSEIKFMQYISIIKLHHINGHIQTILLAEYPDKLLLLTEGPEPLDAAVDDVISVRQDASLGCMCPWVPDNYRKSNTRKTQVSGKPVSESRPLTQSPRKDEKQ